MRFLFAAPGAARVAAGFVCGSGAGAYLTAWAREAQRDANANFVPGEAAAAGDVDAKEQLRREVELTVGHAGKGQELGGAWGLPRFALDWDAEHTENLLGEEGEPSEARGWRSILLVRHGQYFMENGHLTDLGWEQARASAARVAALCDGPSVATKPTSLVVSTAIRARETSEAFETALGLTPTYDDELVEVWPCTANDRDTKPGLDIAAHHDQAESAFRRLFRRPANSRTNEVCVVVCHANVIRYWMLRALQLPPELWTSLSIPHTSITHIRISPSGRVNLRCMGDAGFHPPANVTTSNIPRPKES